MRRLSKKLKIGRHSSKTFSLDSNKVKKKGLQPVGVVLRNVRLHSDSSWIQEDAKTDDQDEVEFALSGDESDWKQTNQQLAVKHQTNTNEHHQHGAKWTKDVIFEAEQLVLKAEIEHLRYRKENKTTTKMVLQDETKETKLDRWSSLPTIIELHDRTESRVKDTDSSVQQSAPKRSSLFKISRKLGKFPSKSLESIQSNPGPNMFKSERNLNKEGSLALIRAAKNNSVFQASSLIKHGISTEIQDQQGWTPLCIALEREHLKCAELLVRWKANVNYVHEDGTTILHHITCLGSYKGVRFLLRHGVDINKHDAHGWPAVHYGLQGGHLKCTALLIAAGCDSESYTRKRIDEYQSVVKMATAGKWRYQWHAQLDIDLDNQIHL